MENEGLGFWPMEGDSDSIFLNESIAYTNSVSDTIVDINGDSRKLFPLSIEAQLLSECNTTIKISQIPHTLEGRNLELSFYAHNSKSNTNHLLHPSLQHGKVQRVTNSKVEWSFKFEKVPFKNTEKNISFYVKQEEKVILCADKLTISAHSSAKKLLRHSMIKLNFETNKYTLEGLSKQKRYVSLPQPHSHVPNIISPPPQSVPSTYVVSKEDQSFRWSVSTFAQLVAFVQHKFKIEGSSFQIQYLDPVYKKYITVNDEDDLLAYALLNSPPPKPVLEVIDARVLELKRPKLRIPDHLPQPAAITAELAETTDKKYNRTVRLPQGEDIICFDIRGPSSASRSSALLLFPLTPMHLQVRMEWATGTVSLHSSVIQELEEVAISLPDTLTPNFTLIFEAHVRELLCTFKMLVSQLDLRIP